VRKVSIVQTLLLSATAGWQHVYVPVPRSVQGTQREGHAGRGAAGAGVVAGDRGTTKQGDGAARTLQRVTVRTPCPCENIFFSFRFNHIQGAKRANPSQNAWKAANWG
jgi:hypothetical protein